MRTLHVYTTLVVLIWLYPLSGQAQQPQILPTESAAKKIRSIQHDLTADLNAGNVQSYRKRHDRQFEQLKNIVTSFVIAQLEAEPDIPWRQLRNQLVRILGTEFDKRTPDHFHEPPYAFGLGGRYRSKRP